MNGLVEVLAGLVIGLVVLYAGWRNLSVGDTPGQFFAFITALLMASDPLRRLSRMQLQLTAAAVGAQMMYDLLDTPALREGCARRRRSWACERGEVRFEKVCFAYKPGTPVLTDLDLIAPAGRTTALVGPSGGGKTTVFNLLQGLLGARARARSPSTGNPLPSVSLASLRRQIALVSQDVFLFDGTIARQHQGRTAGCHRRGGGGGRARGARRRLHPLAAQRLRYARWASLAPTCRAASASASRSPAPS